MRSFILRLSVFACLVTVFSLPGFVVVPQERERINIFDKKNTNTPRREVQRTIRGDKIEQLSQSLREDFNPETKETRKAFLYFGICFTCIAIIVAGLVYWQILRRKQQERELNDPLYLLQELNYVHQLSEQDRRFMLELSERNVLSTPLPLFVEPKFLLDAWEDDTYTSSRTTLRRLLHQLFEITLESGEETIFSSKVGLETRVIPPRTQA